MRLIALSLALACALAVVHIAEDAFIANVLSYGARGDGVTMNTAAIVSAIADVASHGGGVLYFPPGTYLTCPFNLTSNMELRLDNSTLLASPLFSDWAIIAPLPSYGRGRDFPGPRYTSLIHGYNLTSVKITSNSSGVINGQGTEWWAAVKNGSLTVTPGHLLELLWSDGIEVSNLHFVDSPFWNIHPWSSNDVHVHDVVVRAPNTSVNTDGVDPDSCSNVLLERLDIITGDDCIAVKSGWNQFGVNYGVPTVNVVITNMTCTTPKAACIAIGSEMSGGVANVTASGINCSLVGTGLNVKSALGRGGYVRNITFNDVIMGPGVVGTALMAADTYSDQYPPAPLNTSLVPIVDGILISNVVVTSGSGVVNQLGAFEGLNVSWIKNVHMENVTLGTPIKKTWGCSNVTGTYKNVQPTPCSAFQPGDMLLW